MGKLTITSTEIAERHSKLKKHSKFDCVAEFTVANEDPKVIDYIFGDYLRFKHPKRKLLAVAATAKAAWRVRASFPNLKLKVGTIKAVQEAPMQNPKQTLVKLMLSARRAAAARNVVVEHLWPNILDFVQIERTKINFANAFPQLVDVQKVEQLCPTTGFQSRLARILAELIKRGSADPNPTQKAEEMLTTRGVPEFLQRSMNPALVNHPFWGKSAEELAIRILDHHSTAKVVDNIARRSDLKARLEVVGCNLREDSKFCKDYIQMNTMCEVEEVVATMIITKGLFDHGHAAWSQGRSQFEARLRRMVLQEGQQWIPAAKQIVASSEFSSTARSAVAAVFWRRSRYSDYSDYSDSDGGYDYGYGRYY